MPKFNAGDIFAIPLPNEQYVSGRVLLDVTKQAEDRDLIDEDSPFYFYSAKVLVEIYNDLSDEPTFKEGTEVLIPGVMTGGECLKKGEWPILGYKEVDPTKVEFPEGIHWVNNRRVFVRGEVMLPLPQGRPELEQLDVKPITISPYLLPQVCMYYLGLKDQIDPKFARAMTLERSDLRFTDHRKSVYEALGEDENESYYDLSTRKGYDITRFYEKG